MTLQETLKPKTSKNNSNKNPAYYNNEKTLFIVEASVCNEAKVRMFAATSSRIPTKILTAMLGLEQDKQVLRAVLFNSKLPRKAVALFITSKDERVDWFEKDVELIEHFTKE